MSAAPPNPASSFSPHQAQAVRHHPQHHSALSTSTPAVDVSGTHAAPSSYHHSSYATAPSSTPTPHQHQSQPQSYHLSTSHSAIHPSSSSASLAHMARLQSHFSQLAPSCSAHLADQNAIPILSTTPHPGSPGLSSLSSAFVQAHDTASRLGLGVPLRVTLTTGAGAAVIQSGVLPEGGEEDEEHGHHGHGNGVRNGNGGEGVMLVGTVIAPGDRLAEARIASWGVEDVARKFQRYMCDGK